MSDLTRVPISTHYDTEDQKLIMDMSRYHTGGEEVSFIRKPLDKSEVSDLIKNLRTLMKQM